MDAKEKRIRSKTKLYYLNKAVQEVLVKFSEGREVVPRYYEGFGKRPDILQYISDVDGLVRKGATSFHASEEIWYNPLSLDSDMQHREMTNLRKGWDLLIDVDSPFLDCSKIATKLLIAALEQHGVKNFGLKFSGSKGFHILVSWKAFGDKLGDIETRTMFPEWPRAISEYLMNYIRKDYNLQASEILTDFGAIERRTKLTKSDLIEVRCTVCGRAAKKGTLVKFFCPECKTQVERRNVKLTKRRLKCLNSWCAGILEVEDKKEFYMCDYCKDPRYENIPLTSHAYPDLFEKGSGVSAEKVAALDLVLVAPRHLFRMPYSLHEKTALASVVINKKDIDNFSPKQADPLKIQINNFYPENEPGEAMSLLRSALAWKREQTTQESEVTKKMYEGKNFTPVDIKDLRPEMYPPAIKKLLNGLSDGRKRGLFILLTFLKSLGYPNEELVKQIKEWNEKNDPPLKEGYVRSQIDWHVKQRKKILPPNYENDSFYKDLGLITDKQKSKNPLVDVLKTMRKGK